MKDFLVGGLSLKSSVYTLLHDRYYGNLLSSEERKESLSSSKVYRQGGLLSLPSPKTGVVDVCHFTECILEEFIRNPNYFQKAFKGFEEQDLWRYFHPLWDWYFPYRVEVLLKTPLLNKSFPAYCKNLWERKVT